MSVCFIIFSNRGGFRCRFLSKTHCVHVYTTGRKRKVRTKLIINLSVVIGDGARRFKITQKGERIVLNEETVHFSFAGSLCNIHSQNITRAKNSLDCQDLLVWISNCNIGDQPANADITTEASARMFIQNIENMYP